MAHFVSPSLQASWTGSPLCLPLQPPSRTTTLVRGKGRVQKKLPKNDLICQVDLPLVNPILWDHGCQLWQVWQVRRKFMAAKITLRLTEYVCTIDQISFHQAILLRYFAIRPTRLIPLVGTKARTLKFGAGRSSQKMSTVYLAETHDNPRTQSNNLSSMHGICHASCGTFSVFIM